jgi:hypothetical protein
VADSKKPVSIEEGKEDELDLVRAKEFELMAWIIEEVFHPGMHVGEERGEELRAFLQ